MIPMQIKVNDLMFFRTIRYENCRSITDNVFLSTSKRRKRLSEDTTEMFWDYFPEGEFDLPESDSEEDQETRQKILDKLGASGVIVDKLLEMIKISGVAKSYHKNGRMKSKSYYCRGFLYSPISPNTPALICWNEKGQIIYTK